MKLTSRFPIAVHILLCIGYFSRRERTTSEFIAGSVNVNPVMVRQSLQRLKAAGLVTVERGVGGAHLTRNLDQITLLDAFRASDAYEDTLFALHDAPNPECPIGRAIVPVLAERLEEAQRALEDNLAHTTLAELLDQVLAH